MDIVQFIDDIISLQQTLIIMILILVNFASGCLAGIKLGTFCWGKVWEWEKRVLIAFGVYLIVCVPTFFISSAYGQGWENIRALALASIMAMLMDKILVNLKELGLPLPATTEVGYLKATQKVPQNAKVTSVLCALPGLRLLSRRL